MTMIVDIPGLQGQLDVLYRERRNEEFLLGIQQLILTLLHTPGIKANALYEPVSDRYLQKFAELNFGFARRKPRPEAILHVATEVYEFGGHTRVFEDIVAALPEYQHTLVLTDILGSYGSGRLKLGFLEERFNRLGVRVVHLTAPTRMERADQLSRTIDRIAPHTIFINAHHFDVIAYGSICKASAPRVHLLHHCDYEPSLGATRDDYEHCDISYKCHSHCKDHGFVTPQMLHMSIADKGVLEVDWTAPLVGLTCGTYNKFAGQCGFSYGELVGELLKLGVSSMHHVGELPDPQRDEIIKAITDAGQDPSRFSYHGTVGSLSSTIQLVKPSFYLNSHPGGGLKSSLEAMSLGLPILQAAPLEKPDLYLLPDEAGEIASFASFDELPGILARLRSDGAQWAHRNRTHYEKTFKPESFRRRLEAMVGPDTAEPAQFERSAQPSRG